MVVLRSYILTKYWKRCLTMRNMDTKKRQPWYEAHF